MLVIWLFMLFFLSLILILRKEEKKEFIKALRSLKEVKKDYQAFFFELLRTQHLGEGIFKKVDALPSFFSYSSRIFELLLITRETGASKNIWGKILRHNFQTQINFQIALKEKTKEIFFQVFIIYLLTYLFAYLLIMSLDNISFSLLPIVLWQVFGLFLFIFAYKILYKSKFETTDKVLSSLISFQCLISLGLPQQKIIERSGIGLIKGRGGFKKISDWIDELILMWRTKGIAVNEEIKLIQDEAWWQMEQTREKFFLHLSGFRLLILFLFAIPSYFYLIYQVGAALIANS